MVYSRITLLFDQKCPKLGSAACFIRMNAWMPDLSKKWFTKQGLKYRQVANQILTSCALAGMPSPNLQVTLALESFNSLIRAAYSVKTNVNKAPVLLPLPVRAQRLSQMGRKLLSATYLFFKMNPA